MLVLSRKELESIRIGPDIVIRIEKIKGNQVRVSINAPRELRIERFEEDDPSQLDNQGD